MPAARLEVERLSAGYGPTQIVSDMSFEVPAGGRLAILGRNGVGKTTLLATLMGLSTRHRGRIVADGQDISSMRTSARALCGMGYVPQTRDIFGSLTVEENLSTGFKTRERDGLAGIYEMFPRLAERRRHLGLQLSGGEQQIERALNFADRVMVVERGRAVWEGVSDELKSDRSLVNRLLGVGIH